MRSHTPNLRVLRGDHPGSRTHRIASLLVGMLDASVQLDGMREPMRLAGSLAEVRGGAGSLVLPPMRLDQLGSPWNTIKPDGALSVAWEPFTLRRGVFDGSEHLREVIRDSPELEGMGTTLTAILFAGGRLALCHVGDSRAYLLRDGELHQLTHDHTLVQSLIDEGRLTADEAVDHPRRSVLVRTLQEGSPAEPDLFPIDGRIGDRFLVCSDGVTAVLDADEIHEVLTDVAEPADVVDRLIALANEGGLKREDFGAIQIKPDFSIVELPASLGNDVFDRLENTRISGKLIEIRADSRGGVRRETGTRRDGARYGERDDRGSRDDRGGYGDDRKPRHTRD